MRKTALIGVDAGAVDDLHELRRADDSVAEALGGGRSGGGVEQCAVPALVERVRLRERVLGVGELALQGGVAAANPARHRGVAAGGQDEHDGEHDEQDDAERGDRDEGHRLDAIGLGERGSSGRASGGRRRASADPTLRGAEALRGAAL